MKQLKKYNSDDSVLSSQFSDHASVKKIGKCQLEVILDTFEFTLMPMEEMKKGYCCHYKC